MSFQVPVDNGSFKSPHPVLHTAGKNPGPTPCIQRPTQPVLFGSKSGSDLFEARSICRLDRTYLSSTEKTTPSIRTILPSNFSRFSPLRSTVKNSIDQHDEAEFP